MSSADIAQKWANNLGSASTSITAGVNAVTVAPTQKAAARQQAYLDGVNRAVSSGKWQRGLQRVSLQQWQQAMIQKGVPRVASGARDAVPKMQSFMDKWMPHMAALQNKLASMPRGDLNTNIQRAVTAIQHNASFQYT